MTSREEFEATTKQVTPQVTPQVICAEQPTQEPFNNHYVVLIGSGGSGGSDASKQEPFDVVQDSKGNLIPLYTHPKQWQGLSDDEIWDIANFLGQNKEWDYPVMFAKTIEKVLREKNDG